MGNDAILKRKRQHKRQKKENGRNRASKGSE